MAKVHYLTVQDLLWINLQVSQKVHHYQFARLEEAAFCQYSLGAQTGVETQSARLLSGVLRLKPFDAANEATALVGCETFLNLNGKKLDLTDDQVPAWLAPVIAGKIPATDAVNGHIICSEEDSEGNVQASVQNAMEKFECSVQQLIEDGS
jgi:prophage maintenance system killer protein